MDRDKTANELSFSIIREAMFGIVITSIAGTTMDIMVRQAVQFLILWK